MQLCMTLPVQVARYSRATSRQKPSTTTYIRAAKLSSFAFTNSRPSPNCQQKDQLSSKGSPLSCTTVEKSALASFDSNFILVLSAPSSVTTTTLPQSPTSSVLQIMAIRYMLSLNPSQNWQLPLFTTLPTSPFQYIFHLVPEALLLTSQSSYQYFRLPHYALNRRQDSLLLERLFKCAFRNITWRELKFQKDFSSLSNYDSTICKVELSQTGLGWQAGSCSYLRMKKSQTTKAATRIATLSNIEPKTVRFTLVRQPLRVLARPAHSSQSQMARDLRPA